MSDPSTTAFFSPIADGMSAVDRVIRARLQSAVPLVEQVGDYIISGGGKRVRPALLLLTAGALEAHLQASQSGSGPLADSPQVYELAAIVEFIHTATLLHDDVVDESGMRRNRQTANAIFGNAASVLVGDFLYSRAFQMMLSCDSLAVMSVLADATNVIAEGEVLQLLNCQDPDVDEARYLQVIRFKTAKLFEASACLPAVLAGCSADLIERMRAVGRHLGTAFQLTDDVLDYDGDESIMGKQLGDDLREGKPTLPLILLMAQSSATQREQLRAAILDPESADIAGIIHMVRQSGVLNTTWEAARAECDLARTALEVLSPSEHKSSLLDLLSFITSRRQ
ncbi:MAG: polyprenyl synthetase family protein [Burkholderiaceae bacterium]